mgnify:CR=1 FL=1
MCTEIGPYKFRIDWGRVVKLRKYEFIEFTWQISSNREPIPDPEKASRVRVNFKAVSNNMTKVELEHFNFDGHGEEGGSYRDVMDGEMGWDYILEKFAKYCIEM